MPARRAHRLRVVIPLITIVSGGINNTCQTLMLTVAKALDIAFQLNDNNEQGTMFKPLYHSDITVCVVIYERNSVVKSSMRCTNRSCSFSTQ